MHLFALPTLLQTRYRLLQLREHTCRRLDNTHVIRSGTKTRLQDALRTMRKHRSRAHHSHNTDVSLTPTQPQPSLPAADRPYHPSNNSYPPPVSRDDVSGMSSEYLPSSASGSDTSVDRSPMAHRSPRRLYTTPSTPEASGRPHPVNVNAPSHPQLRPRPSAYSPA